MIRRYCDRCKCEITNRDFRLLSITDPDNCLIEKNGEYTKDTINNVELCRSCAYTILKMIKDRQYLI